jgi:predicted  nucleic acid-binding Zn-ribbon protein
VAVFLHIWVIVALFVVVGVKFYTSREMAQLERRLHAVKTELHTKKVELDTFHVNQVETKKAEEAMENRITHMKEIIQDINVRLTQSDPSIESRSVAVQNIIEGQQQTPEHFASGFVVDPIA